jgi:hypothetical protein
LSDGTDDGLSFGDVWKTTLFQMEEKDERWGNRFIAVGKDDVVQFL